MANPDVGESPTFQALDASLEDLFSPEGKITPSLNQRPATFALTRLLRGVTISIRHCTRNRHKLYRIALRSHQILRQIHQDAVQIESLSTDAIDESAFVLFDTYAESICTLESCLEQLFNVLPQETLPFPRSDLLSWFPNTTTICNVYTRLYAPPFTVPEDLGTATLKDDVYYDRCFWFAMVSHHATDVIDRLELSTEDEKVIMESLARMEVATMKRTVTPATQDFGINFATFVCILPTLDSEQESLWQEAAKFLRTLPPEDDLSISETDQRKWDEFTESLFDVASDASDVTQTEYQGTAPDPTQIDSGERQRATMDLPVHGRTSNKPATSTSTEPSVMSRIRRRVTGPWKWQLSGAYRQMMENNARELAALQVTLITLTPRPERDRLVDSLSQLSEHMEAELSKRATFSDLVTSTRLENARRIRNHLARIAHDLDRTLVDPVPVQEAKFKAGTSIPYIGPDEAKAEVMTIAGKSALGSDDFTPAAESDKDQGTPSVLPKKEISDSSEAGTSKNLRPPHESQMRKDF